MEEAGLTPYEVVKILQEGNARFLTSTPQHPNRDRSRRTVTANEGQHPIVTVLACADSRVPVELIFDRGIGDVFVVRVAGNVLGPSELGSIEYAVEHLGTPVFTVMGHNNCGAVKAVVEEGELPGNLRPLSQKIMPAVEEARAENPGLLLSQLVDEAARLNVMLAIEDAFKNSHIIRERAKKGLVKVIGSFYDIDTGSIQWMGKHPRQDQLLNVQTELNEDRFSAVS